jgi:hypothetical protein
MTPEMLAEVQAEVRRIIREELCVDVALTKKGGTAWGQQVYYTTEVVVTATINGVPVSTRTASFKEHM